jgi:hypothetical protein
VAADTSTSAEMKAPANKVAVSRIEAAVNMVEPLLHSLEPDHRVHAVINARGVPI